MRLEPRAKGETMMLAPELEKAAIGVSTEFFLPGYTRDDLRQEARAAALEALQVRKADGLSERGFVRLVVRRRLTDLLRQVQRRPLDHAATLEEWLHPTRTDDGLLEAREAIRELLAGCPGGWASEYGYNNNGCRCPLCREAHRAKRVARMHRRAA